MTYIQYVKWILKIAVTMMFCHLQPKEFWYTYKAPILDVYISYQYMI